MKTGSRSGWINFSALVLVNLLWAAQYPAYRIASLHMEVAALNFWVLFFSILMLIPFQIRARREKPGAPITGRTVVEFTVLGLVGIIPPSVFLAWGINHSSASNASILALTIPILMTVLGVIMLAEKITAVRVLSLLIGIAGTILISTSDVANASFSKNVLIGNVVIFLAGAGSAFYNAYGKGLLARYSELDVLIYSYVVAVAGCAVLSVLTESKPFYRATGYPVSVWIAVLVLGLLSWGFAMVLWMWVLNRLDVGQVSVSIYLLPFFGLLLSIATLHETISRRQIVGGMLVLFGTAMLTVYEHRRTAALGEGTT